MVRPFLLPTQVELAEMMDKSRRTIQKIIKQYAKTLINKGFLRLQPSKKPTFYQILDKSGKLVLNSQLKHKRII